MNLASSIIAVPPLARAADGKLAPEENAKIIRHIESGGVSILLYGGNANLYHTRPSEYGELATMLTELPAASTAVVPAVGPAWGTAMDQAEVLRDFDFPTTMLLPMAGVTTDDGVATGFRRYVEAVGKPAVLYIKADGYLSPTTAGKLAEDGLISWIKYATVRDDPAHDPYLSELVDCVNPGIIVSGIGEQPAITHLKDFGLTGFTSGCVCIRPDLSQRMLEALNADDLDTAEPIRQSFRPLEELRNSIHPIRVLHEAVALAGIAQTGPHLPLLSELGKGEAEQVKAAALGLLNR